MIWHIFRKDWKLLWWKVLIVEALLIWMTAADSVQGHFRGGRPYTIEIAGAMLVFAAGIFLIADLAHVDPTAGMGQDWIARPISRMNLLLAKVLFLIVAGSPIFLIGAAQDIAYGFPLASSLSGAMVDSMTTVLAIGLPMLAFASLFSSMTETIAAAFIAILAKFALGFLAQGSPKFPLIGPVSGSAIHWVIDYGQSWVYFTGALAILVIQYFRRRTARARWVAAAILAITSLAPLLPWQYAFAVERRLSPMPGAGTGANLVFNPLSGRANDGVGDFTACIPIAVSGVTDSFWLNIDGVKASVVDGDKTIWNHRMGGAIDTSTLIVGKMRGELMETKGSGVCQPIAIPKYELKGLEDRPVRVQLDYSLTLFGPDKSYAIPAVGGDERMPGVGWCQTLGTFVKDRVEIGCISDNGQACLEASAANAPASTAWYCNPDYDAIHDVDTDPWGGPLHLEVHQGDTLVLRSYRPLDHFERVVTTPEIKLDDWLTASQ